MRRIENDCVMCPQGCTDCGRKQTEHLYCDDCKEEMPLYEFEDGEFCIHCIEKRLTKVE